LLGVFGSMMFLAWVRGYAIPVGILRFLAGVAVLVGMANYPTAALAQEELFVKPCSEILEEGERYAY
jgi:hypothetical protein